MSSSFEYGRLRLKYPQIPPVDWEALQLALQDYDLRYKIDDISLRLKKRMKPLEGYPIIDSTWNTVLYIAQELDYEIKSELAGIVVFEDKSSWRLYREYMIPSFSGLKLLFYCALNDERELVCRLVHS